MSRVPLGAGADIEHDHPVPPGGEVAHGKLLDLLEGLPFGTPERERLGAEVPPDPIEPDHRETPEHPRDRLGPGLVYQEIELPIVRQERAGPGREAPIEGKVQAGRKVPRGKLGPRPRVHQHGARRQHAFELVLGDPLRQRERPPRRRPRPPPAPPRPRPLGGAVRPPPPPPRPPPRPPGPPRPPPSPPGKK